MIIKNITKEFLSENISKFISIIKQNSNEYWTEEHFLSELPQKWELSLVALENNDVISFIIASQKDNSVHIHKFFTDKEYQNKGFAKKLLYKLECLTLDNITLKVAKNNINAIAFYRKNAFSTIETSEYLTMKKVRKIVGIHQPNYCPWLGFFDKIKKSDQFVIIDNVQYVKNSIISRNKILDSKNEASWFPIPVKISKGSEQMINEINIDYSQQKLINKQLNRLQSFYQKAPYFKEYFPKIKELVLHKHLNLAEKNIALIRFFIDIFELNTPISISSEIGIDFGKKNDLNLNITKHFSGNTYLSGNGAKTYNNHDFFEQNQISLVYQKFAHPIYEQNSNEFVSHLSAIDALFFLGKEIKHLI